MTNSACPKCGSTGVIYTMPMYCAKCGTEIPGSGVIPEASPERTLEILCRWLVEIDDNYGVYAPRADDDHGAQRIIAQIQRTLKKIDAR